MSIDNSHAEVFKSKRDKRATMMVWGIALILWIFSYSIIASKGPIIDRFIGTGIVFLLGGIGPWFWFTTKHRITTTSLHLQSGAFNKELKLHEIRRVTDEVPVRGWTLPSPETACISKQKDRPAAIKYHPWIVKDSWQRSHGDLTTWRPEEKNWFF